MREFSEAHQATLGRPFRVGVAASAGPLPAWKRDADYLFAQVGFSLDDFLRWRSTINFDGPVYAGVMVVPSASMARKIGIQISGVCSFLFWPYPMTSNDSAIRTRSL